MITIIAAMVGFNLGMLLTAALVAAKNADARAKRFD